MIHYDNKRFASIANTDNGEVDARTIFDYHQQDDVVWATYAGGSIQFGTLIATVDDTGHLDMRYHHVNQAGVIMTGKCLSTPEVLSDGRIRLHEKWQWTSGDGSQGESMVEEIHDL